VIRAVCSPHLSNEFERFSVPRQGPGPARFRTQRTFSVQHLGRGSLEFLGTKIVGLSPSYILVEFNDGIRVIEPLVDYVDRLGHSKVILEGLKRLSDGKIKQS